ncbi:adenosylmethionine decarboxylase [Fimicolochytrium jonesii]|uniref:adenosylmethionine decarboxylase n=1 Tax=Fimicolochytrium jonesii TaxID=1396493 RepID=UPI0022FEC8C6|nr:adenosylmethionine decarboxylase [Fimicolochytrium jonesii]KAI8824080.1 adenosylmethionine decarboxylase [Fimicolochytrium jonesii]
MIIDKTASASSGTALDKHNPVPELGNLDLNSQIYSSTYPTPLAPESDAVQQTLCGFEGPEKVFEIWFRPVNGKESPLPDVESVASEDNASVDEIVEDFTPIGKHVYNSTVPNADGEYQLPRTGLRTVSRDVWEEMLGIVKCQVLNVIQNECADAYLLSESSMFVYQHRLILKTCGTTTLLHAVPKIIEIAAEYCGLHEINAVFYSRKAFLFPEKQAWPHGRWGDEVAYLDKILPDTDYETSGYVIGKVNGDHWCLYMATPLRLSLDLDGVELGDSSSSSRDSDGGSSVLEEEDDEGDDDVTLEILMTQLDPAAMKTFWRDAEELKAARDPARAAEVAREGGQRVYRATGISEIYPDAIVDDYLFDPCGYSLNGLVGPHYFTIHVTPEDHCSYASFETTVPVRRSPNSGSATADDYETFEDVIRRVVRIFRPATFSTTLFSRKSARDKHHGSADTATPVDEDEPSLLHSLEGSVPAFRRRDRIGHCLGKWDLLFCHYDRGVPASASPRHKGAKAVVR